MTDWLIFNAAGQVNFAKALNDNERRLEPRRFDKPGHPQFGKWTLQASIITARGYERFSNRIDQLARLTAEPEDLFAPSTE